MGDVIDLHAERRRRRPVSIGGVPVVADPAVPEGYAVVIPGGQVVNLASGELLDMGERFAREAYGIAGEARGRGDVMLNPSQASILNRDAERLAEFAETGEIKSVSRDRDDADQSPERGDPEAPRRRRLDTGHTRRRTGAP